MIDTLLIVMLSLQGAAFAAYGVFMVTQVDMVINDTPENIKFFLIGLASIAASVFDFWVIFK